MIASVVFDSDVAKAMFQQLMGRDVEFYRESSVGLSMVRIASEDPQGSPSRLPTSYTKPVKGVVPTFVQYEPIRCDLVRGIGTPVRLVVAAIGYDSYDDGQVIMIPSCHSAYQTDTWYVGPSFVGSNSPRVVFSFQHHEIDVPVWSGDRRSVLSCRLRPDSPPAETRSCDYGKKTYPMTVVLQHGRCEDIP